MNVCTSILILSHVVVERFLFAIFLNIAKVDKKEDYYSFSTTFYHQSSPRYYFLILSFLQLSSTLEIQTAACFVTYSLMQNMISCGKLYHTSVILCRISEDKEDEEFLTISVELRLKWDNSSFLQS